MQASLSPRSNTLTAEAESPTDMSVDEFLPAEGEGGGRESEDSSYSQSPTGQNTVSQSLDHREALNRELLLDAFQQLSLHDRCALSLSLDHSRSPPPEHVQQSDSDVDIFSDIGSVISDADVAEAIGSEDGIKAAIDAMSEDEKASLAAQVLCIQSNVKGWLMRRNYRQLSNATRTMQRNIRSLLAQKSYKRLRDATKTIENNRLTLLHQRRFQQTRDATLTLQAATRRALRRRLTAALVINRNARLWLKRSTPSE